MTSPFESGKPILEKLNEAGFEAYFVGGAVRDFLLGRKIGDIDIATSAKPEEVKSIFPKTVDVGIEHGTVLVIYNGEGYEVTTFRKESEYEDYRRPKSVEFISSLEEDLQRRDFTINALAMDLNGDIHDPFNGKNDLVNKMIRCVGSPSERFMEDALRMMRAIRFQSQLGFQIEEETFNSLVQLAHLLEKIAVERILIEWSKLLGGKYKSSAFQSLIDTGLFQRLPANEELSSGIQDFLHYEVNDLEAEESWLLLLYKSNVQSPYTVLKKWKTPKALQKKLDSLLMWLQFRLKHEWTPFALYRAGIENALLVERVFNCIAGRELSVSSYTLKTLYDQLPIQNREDLFIDGNDLLKWTNHTPGPWLKEWMGYIEKAVVEGRIGNDKEEIREWFLNEFK
ncbi:CCA tRNA nucleotidyltransferase [Bacillus litorisediminis]|uniref:CCA tRNA nucleotidyltransferase n=1 Tax=Bacillus litorisediminis TaxID=2922713 RepID=UPI001FABD891|nr:CCA tRNA nucleotidyltransferase [Bacillus litorisediminis]